MINERNEFIENIEVVDAIDVSAPKPQYTSEDLYEKYIVHVGTGTALQVMPKDAAFVYLLGGPTPMTAPIVKLIKFLEQGVWRFAYPGEALNQRPEPTQEQINHKNKVLKALMYFQLAMEANDDLKGTLDHNKYLDNVLRKAVRELERYAAKDIKNVYGADPQLITNVFNAMDRSVERMVAFLPHEYFFIEMVLDDYMADPQKVQERPVTVLKMNTETNEPAELYVVVEQTNTGFSAYARDVNGLTTVGETIAEIKENFKEVLEYHIQYVNEMDENSTAKPEDFKLVFLV